MLSIVDSFGARGPDRYEHHEPSMSGYALGRPAEQLADPFLSAQWPSAADWARDPLAAAGAAYHAAHTIRLPSAESLAEGPRTAWEKATSSPHAVAGAVAELPSEFLMAFALKTPTAPVARVVTRAADKIIPQSLRPSLQQISLPITKHTITGAPVVQRETVWQGLVVGTRPVAGKQTFSAASGGGQQYTVAGIKRVDPTKIDYERTAVGQAPWYEQGARQGGQGLVYGPSGRAQNPPKQGGPGLHPKARHLYP